MTVRRSVPLPVLVVVLAIALASPSSAALFCWGSICQDASGYVFMAKDVSPKDGRIALSTAPGAQTIPGDVVISCTRYPVVAPGYAAGTLRFRPGPTPDTMQLVIIVGTSKTEVPIGPPIPGGSC